MKRATVLSLLALVLLGLGASSARAHPFGQQPVLFLARTQTGIAARWVANPTEFQALSQHLGLGPVSMRALAGQPAFQDYFRERLRIEGCSSIVTGITPVTDGGVVGVVFDCGERPRRITLHVTLLQDISTKYVNLVTAQAGADDVRGALTGDTTTLEIDFGAATSEAPPFTGGEAEAGRAQRIVAALQGTGSIWLMLGLAFLLGLFHGVTPGHGKTIAAAYLVGSGGTTRQALALGGVVAGTHALSTALIAAFPIWLGRTQPPGSLSSWLEIAAGTLILILGVALLRRPRHGHDHDTAEAEPPPLRRLAGIGFVGGLVPNPEALLVVLVAFSLGRWTTGAALVGAFSVGLGLVVLGIALAAVRGGSFIRRLGGGRLARWAPRAAAAVFVLMGTVVVVRGAVGL
ncbi:MAG TPA: hypothetical protein VGB52_07675 [Actinomycetota bacterium]